MNFYNEIDEAAALWLEELIQAGEIPPGVVDRRDIRDIRPDELDRYTQCHFFAGIGGWSRALRLAGWPDDWPRPTDGFWQDADWLHCRDGKWRPVEPGTFPLAHGVPGRVGLLRGYGNAIVPEVAAAFVEAFEEAAPSARSDCRV